MSRAEEPRPEEPRPGELSSDAIRLAAAVSERIRASGRTVAVAESLTSGSLSSHLGAAETSSDWFLGGVIAYAKAVKFNVLGVEPGPVVTASCATQMLSGVLRLTGADFAAAVTGVGGPGPEEGKPSGTVFIAAGQAGDIRVLEHHFGGDPAQVVHETTVAALQMLLDAVSA